MALYRNFYRDYKTTSPFIVEVYGLATIGGSAAVASSIGRGGTVSKVSGTGKYQIALDCKGGVPQILTTIVTPVHATNAYTVAVTGYNLTTGVITFTVSLAGTATDPASGTLLPFRVAVLNNKYIG